MPISKRNKGELIVVKKRITIIIAILLVTALIVGCGNGQTETDCDTEEKKVIRIGILQVEDILPLVVGNEEGFFAEKGMVVDLTIFPSPTDKANAFLAGELDASVTDMIVTYLMAAQVPVRIGALTTGVTPEEGPFGIVAAPGSGIYTVQDLDGKSVGISFNTIIEYVLDGILAQEGLSPDFVEKTLVASLPVRMEMLLSGQIDAAIFPDPLLTFAQYQGAVLVADDTTGENLSQVVMIFHSQFAEENMDLLRDFFAAYTQSVSAINSNPENFRELFINGARIPEQIAATYPIPVFPYPQLPQQADMERVENWLLDKGVLDAPINYEDLIIDGLH